jgi:hypothetical protein
MMPQALERYHAARYTRAIVIGLLIFLHVPRASGDRLDAAAKGKKQTSETHYGRISSFDGTTLIFEKLAPMPWGTPKRDEILAGPKTMSIEFTVKDTKIEIALGVRDPQEAVDGYHPENSTPQTTHDVDLQLAELQKRTAPAKEIPVLDLTRCSGRGIDRVVETNPQLSGATKRPVQGELQSIAGGIATLKRASDGAVMKYRLDMLTEVRIGMCR